MNKKIILSFLLILLVGSVSAVMAVGDGENVTYQHYGNGSYVFNDTNNDTVYGYCLNATKSSPSTGSSMSVSNDTSSVNNTIKELIVTYYRGDLSENYNDNVALRTAIWNITNHNSLGTNTSLSYQMMTYVGQNPLGPIGDSYTFSDGVYNYIFNFFMGKSSSSSVQPMLLFTFVQELIPEEPPEPPEEPINETNETNNTNITPIIPVVPNETNITNDTVPNETNITNDTVNNTTEENGTINVEPKPPVEETTDTIAEMKETGIPIAILVLISILGLGYYKRD